VSAAPSAESAFGHVGKDPMTCDCREVITDELSQIPEIEKVLLSAEGKCISVWTVVSNASDQVRDSIYDRELRIMDRLQFGLDFHVLDRADQPIEELVSGTTVAFSRQ
jgi:hypothetical protein